jgi:hypothetical protein
MRPNRQPTLPFALRRDPATGLECCPTREEAARLTPAQLDALHVYLDERLAAHLETLPGEGTAHSSPIIDTRDRLKGHFERIGRGVFIAPNIGVHYEGVPPFAPDLIAVLDVPLHDRTRWRVDVEGRGVDFLLEILVDGDRRKDLVENVRIYASLGIPEYLVYNVREQSLTGWRLETPEASTYIRIVPQLGRLPSRVLGLDFAIVEHQLRIWRDGAEVPSTSDLVKLLGSLVTTKEAEVELARAEVEQSRARVRRGILRTLRLRGLEPTPDEATAIETCDDPDRLARWDDRVLDVATVAELLTD